MSLIATLISNPVDNALDQSLAKAAGESVDTSQLTWLARDIACDIPLPDHIIDPQDKLRNALGDSPIDIVIQPVENRRKKLLVADMDSTMIGQECLDEMAEMAGVGDKVRHVTARAMAGELDFEEALRSRLLLLEGFPVPKLVEVIKQRITLTPGARELVQTMKKHGAYSALISGGFTQFTAYVARQCGFDDHQANQLEIVKGILTGKPIEPVLGQKSKLRAITEMTLMHSLSFSQTMAVGDGANDISMLKRAGLGVAYHAKPAVREMANAVINHGDLTALLYMQGYKKSEFVS